MTTIDALNRQLALPVIAAPMFIVSQPELVLAQCLNGIVGSFPALNARPKDLLEDWLTQLTEALTQARRERPGDKVAPFAVNQIVHASNDRLDHDMALCVKHEVPLIITSLRAPGDVVREVHSYGGLVFHDVISVKYAERAVAEGVDGLILVCAGAGGHTGTLSPFALVSEVRRFWDGPIALSGAIGKGEHILAAQAMGADYAYVGTRFIPTTEAQVIPEYKQAIVEATAADIVKSSWFTGLPANYLRSSIVRQELDPDNLPTRDKSFTQFGSANKPTKAWKEIWSAGQGVGTVDAVESVSTVIARMKVEYEEARRRLCHH
jgi:nitronate monooxygenase